MGRFIPPAPFSKGESETVAFLDVQVNHITNDVRHINNKVLSKNASKIGNFWEMQAFGKEFFAFIRLCAYNKFAFVIYASQTFVGKKICQKPSKSQKNIEILTVSDIKDDSGLRARRLKHYGGGTAICLVCGACPSGQMFASGFLLMGEHKKADIAAGFFVF